MVLVKNWNGKLYGTNTGNLHLRIECTQSEVSGILHVNDDAAGLYSYKVEGTYDENGLNMVGQPQNTNEDFDFGTLTTTARLSPKGNLEGEWETSIGTAGTFALYPHSQVGSHSTDPAPQFYEQSHTKYYDLGAILIDRDQFIDLAEEIQKEFKKERVVISVVSETTHSCYLDAFKAGEPENKKVPIIKIYAQEAEGEDTNKVVAVEFGPEINRLMTQSHDEAWVLGKLAMLRAKVQKFERSYITNYKKLGVGMNQILLLMLIVVLPSLESISDRLFLSSVVLMVIGALGYLHKKFLPFAQIYLGEKPQGFGQKYFPSILSWGMGIIGGTIILVAAGFFLKIFQLS